MEYSNIDDLEQDVLDLLSSAQTASDILGTAVTDADLAEDYEQEGDGEDAREHRREIASNLRRVSATLQGPPPLQDLIAGCDHLANKFEAM